MGWCSRSTGVVLSIESGLNMFLVGQIPGRCSFCKRRAIARRLTFENLSPHRRSTFGDPLQAYGVARVQISGLRRRGVVGRELGVRVMSLRTRRVVG